MTEETTGAQPLSLEIASFDVDDVVVGSPTSFVDGTLTIDVEELKAEALHGEYLGDLSIEIVKPGDDVRVLNAIDAVEPRVKIDPDGQDFPGLLSRPRTAGAGRTHALKGVSVTTTALPVPGEPVYWREALFDMAGPAAAYSPFSELINVVVSVQPAAALADDPTPPDNLFAGTPEAFEYNREIRLAGLRAARYLAAATSEADPTRTDTYEMTEVSSKLPRVVYLYQLAIP